MRAKFILTIGNSNAVILGNPFRLSEPMSLTYCQFWLRDNIRKIRKDKSPYDCVYIEAFDGTIPLQKTKIICKNRFTFAYISKAVSAYARYANSYKLPF